MQRRAQTHVWQQRLRPRPGVCAARLRASLRAAPLSLVWPLGPDLASPDPRRPEGAEPAPASPQRARGCPPGRSRQASEPRLPAACFLVGSKREPQAPATRKRGGGRPSLAQDSGLRRGASSPSGRAELPSLAGTGSCGPAARVRGSGCGEQRCLYSGRRRGTRPPGRVDAPPARPQNTGGT